MDKQFIVPNDVVMQFVFDKNIDVDDIALLLIVLGILVAVRVLLFEDNLVLMVDAIIVVLAAGFVVVIAVDVVAA